MCKGKERQLRYYSNAVTNMTMFSMLFIYKVNRKNIIDYVFKVTSLNYLTLSLTLKIFFYGDGRLNIDIIYRITDLGVPFNVLICLNLNSHKNFFKKKKILLFFHPLNPS